MIKDTREETVETTSRNENTDIAFREDVFTLTRKMV
jgi:hypothetical protein